jgi:hypothetical protein
MRYISQSPNHLGTFPSSLNVVPQTLAVSGQTLSISQGNSVTLPTQSLPIAGQTLSISNGNSVTLPTIGGAQTTITGGQLINYAPGTTSASLGVVPFTFLPGKTYSVSCLMGCVSVYALNPVFQVFDKHVAEEKVRATLMFVVNNNHCYPITDETQRRHVIRTGSLTLQAVEFSKIDMESVTYYEGELSEDEGERISAMTDFVLAAEGHVVLPIDTLEKGARGVIESTNTLIEHFHYYGGLS